MDILPSDPTVGIDPVAVGPPRSVVVLNKKVLLACPWGKMVHPLTAFCVARLADQRRTVTSLSYGDAFVAHSRNSIADLFLETNLDWLLTIDDDMVVPCGNAKWYNAHTGFDLPEKFAGLNTIDRLISHGKTLVGGLYFGRHRNANPVYNEGGHTAEAGYARGAPYDLIKPTKWVGTGVMMTHRSVFEDIEKTFPRLARGLNKKGGQWYSSSEHNIMDAVDETRKFLSTGAMTGEKCLVAYTMLEAAASEAKNHSWLGMGEDVTLCHRATQAGHTAYVDMGLLCGHLGHVCYGPKNTFSKKI